MYQPLLLIQKINSVHLLRHFFTIFKSQKVNFRSSVYGSSRACHFWALNFFLVIDIKSKDDVFTPRVDVIKNLQEVTGRTSSPAWNLWKPFTYCSIEENSFRDLTVWNLNDSFCIVDQDTARYSLCSARENCVNWAEPLKCTADNLFSWRVFLLNL